MERGKTDVFARQQQYKLPNGLVDACVVYGLNGKACEELQRGYSNSKVRGKYITVGFVNYTVDKLHDTLILISKLPAS